MLTAVSTQLSEKNRHGADLRAFLPER